MFPRWLTQHQGARNDVAYAEDPVARKVSEYRRKAADADARAAACDDSFTKSRWEDIANSYREMADRMERNSGLP
jgi:hypothetical protein